MFPMAKAKEDITEVSFHMKKSWEVSVKSWASKKRATPIEIEKKKKSGRPAKHGKIAMSST